MSIAPYESWVGQLALRNARVWSAAERVSANELCRMAREVLDVRPEEDIPRPAAVIERWEADGLIGEVVSWDLGYGPPTEAYLLRPATASVPLPGVLALHCHSDFYWYGKEKIADGPRGPVPGVASAREELYGGRAYTNELAKAGFVVLVHDVFMWGSRRFTLGGDNSSPSKPLDEQVAAFNDGAAAHEHLVEKYCRVLGTTVAAVVAREDRAALAYLASRPEVTSSQLGCIGLSGGGLRACMLHATSDAVRASVVVGMMATYASLLARHIDCHTWMLFPSGWPERGDWPDLVGCRPDVPLLVQYNLEDPLFPADGMRAAHERLTRRYGASGTQGLYEGQFYAGRHKFDLAMQETAISWLRRQLYELPRTRDAGPQ